MVLKIHQMQVVVVMKSKDISIKNLKFVELDLTSDNGWDKAMKGCDFVLHVASPFRIANPKDENEMILPAVEGTKRILKAANKASIKKVILHWIWTEVPMMADVTDWKQNLSKTEKNIISIIMEKK